MKMPLVDLKAQHLELKSEIDAAIRDVVDSQQFIMGPQVAEFEQDLAAYAQVPYAFGCASGTDALQLALMALGVGPGDEVITSPFTFAATVEVIALLGATPVYTDIDLASYNIRVDQVAGLITPRTKAIIPVHLYGQPADMDELLEIGKRHEIPIVEDGAQALGAYYRDEKVCGLGTIGCTSFFPAKNLGAYGDAGGVFTRDEALADRLAKIRAHGSDKRYWHELLGVNSRIDTLQAAILQVKLPHLDRWNQHRQQVAAWYNEQLNPAWVTTPVCGVDRTHIYQQYTIRVEQRDALQQYLTKNGIPSAVHYPTPLYLQPVFRDAQWDSRCPNSEKASNTVLSLPMHPYLTREQVQLVVDTIHGFFEQD
ncbi:MAG: DegT/DnrJ/EryC1/StrS family aminotransferase [Candidatus Marinimicrobia bacterium]|nr:DegT/DnrJ/EryC1/StrS family aminotransferase [Candidatus Neomarinimicrobiota bacterium]MCF7840670.1 DegT/DnrJ/EryC1/StrS family aminotransferase [Candidatus Neomarinimicrobiota bacterium]